MPEATNLWPLIGVVLVVLGFMFRLNPALVVVGSGVVTDIEGNGAHARVQVNFDEAGSKWLVLAYANLQPG